ncbi:MAG: ATP-binding cassette domain-containing protein [Acholeplasmatales bacterium]|jgi:energy-coupling factor transport system ATP-binding protein|nr:ATP-binding cassette domain-containing protein [Acholeplasmatales bacterium]
MSIKFNQVSHSYIPLKYDKFSLKDINIEIEEKSEFVAIVGETGSGKSTLVSHMNALILPSLGNLNIMGTIVNSKYKNKLNFIRKQVGLVFQFPEYQLFEETVLKDVSFGLTNFNKDQVAVKKEAIHALSLVHIDSSLFNESPFRLSGGEQRRVAIAGVLVMNPYILVLDEPTRGLDPKGKEEVMNIFKSIHENENKSIVLITHDMDLVSEYASRVICLKDGSVVFDGSKEELFTLQNISDFNLDYPTSVKIVNELNQKLNLNLPKVFKKEDLINLMENIK